MSISRSFFEKIYQRYNSKRFLSSDPVIFPHRFKDPRDIEIAALISSSLAYGNVKQIINILNRIFEIMKKPSDYMANANTSRIKKDFSRLKHRFTTSHELSSFIIKLKDLHTNNISLENLFLNFYKPQRPLYESYTPFIKNIFSNYFPTLIPDPEKKSAMKRFNLFLRWMVRKDNIDFGLWKNIKKSDLIYPLDTHIHSFALKNKITSRKDNSIKTAYEITCFFKKINPDDPVKYDFAISRTGILKRF